MPEPAAVNPLAPPGPHFQHQIQPPNPIQFPPNQAQVPIAPPLRMNQNQQPQYQQNQNIGDQIININNNNQPLNNLGGFSRGNHMNMSNNNNTAFNNFGINHGGMNNGIPYNNFVNMSDLQLNSGDRLAHSNILNDNTRYMSGS